MNQDERIRERAHQIWESEGCPDGKETEHWQRACDEVEPDREEGSPQAGGIETSVAQPMPRSESD